MSNRIPILFWKKKLVVSGWVSGWSWDQINYSQVFWHIFETRKNRPRRWKEEAMLEMAIGRRPKGKGADVGVNLWFFFNYYKIQKEILYIVLRLEHWQRGMEQLTGEPTSIMCAVYIFLSFALNSQSFFDFLDFGARSDKWNYQIHHDIPLK